jgi:hypothetical protein
MPSSAAEPADTVSTFRLPPLRDVARHALPTVIEGTVLPVLVFWLAIRLLGPWPALLVGLGWVYGCVIRRIVLRRPVPGVFVVAAVTATCRVVVAISTHSLVLYFLQPSLGTVLMSGAFLVSVLLRRPLAARLARDFCPFPEPFFERQWVRAFFLRISLLWSFVLIANAVVTVWLALSQSAQVIALARPGCAAALTVAAIGASAWHFQRSVRRHEPMARNWSLFGARAA